MLFLLFRLIIWMTGLIVVGSFILSYFGYQTNWHYFEERRGACQEEITACRNDLVKSGIDGVKENCEIKCVNPKFFIQKDTK